MTKFFLPHAKTPEMAEQNYQAFAKKAVPYPLVPGRLFRISFPHDRRGLVVAEVGKEIKGWREPSGDVLAIIETTGLIKIFHVHRGALGTIMVGHTEVREKTYFDDFPPG